MGGEERRRRAREQYERQRPKHRLGDAPVEESYHDAMVGIAGMLDEALNGQRGGPGRKTGFVLLVFPFENQAGRCNFVSNGADRRDVVTLMKEMISRFEGQPEQSGRA